MVEANYDDAISIHALREEGDSSPIYLLYIKQISIHALREEGDQLALHRSHRNSYFYPRPPRGGRHILRYGHRGLHEFLSTPSARRATEDAEAYRTRLSIFLSTPSARRATEGAVQHDRVILISIHALREEGDAATGETVFALNRISIHALREEGDGKRHLYGCGLGDFYPRPPRGGRQQKQRQNLYFLINYTTFCTNLEEP